MLTEKERSEAVEIATLFEKIKDPYNKGKAMGTVEAYAEMEEMKQRIIEEVEQKVRKELAEEKKGA